MEIDTNTFDYDILNAIYLASSSVEGGINNFLSSLDYENKTGADLDRYMNMFNIYRISGNPQDIYQFEVSNNGDQQIKILKDSIIEFEKSYYKISKDLIINSNSKNIITGYRTYSSYSFETPIFSAGGEIKFDKKSCFSEKETNISEYFPKYIKLISLELLSNDSESDLSFLERSKSMISSMGFSNNKKIENAILNNPEIKGIYSDNINGTTIMTIFPNNLSNIDDLISYSEEIVRYYQDSFVKIAKPNLIEIRIINLKNQLLHIPEYEKLLNIISNLISEYLSNSLIDNSIKKSDIFNIITDTLKTYNITNNLNFNIIKVKNYFYWNVNYNSPILIEDIKDSLNIGNNNIISFGNID